MKQIEVEVKVGIGGRRGPREVVSVYVNGYLTKTPGLVLTPEVKPDRTTKRRAWVVTHQSSGYALGGVFPTRKQANVVAERLVSDADWTLSEARLKRELGRNGSFELQQRVNRLHSICGAK